MKKINYSLFLIFLLLINSCRNETHNQSNQLSEKDTVAISIKEDNKDTSGQKASNSFFSKENFAKALEIATEIHHFFMQDEIGLKQVHLDSDKKLIFSDIKNITSEDKVLLLVHGWTSSPSSSWTNFLDVLQAKIKQSHYTRFITFGYYSDLPIDENGKTLSSAVHTQLNGATIDIVSHSMGGLISRSAIENHGATIRNLITLGTPHKGALAADLRQVILRNLKNPESIFTQQVDLSSRGMRDLQAASDFIIHLNQNPPTATSYYTIAAKTDIGENITINSDGVVSMESALGVSTNNKKQEKTFYFKAPLPKKLNDIRELSEIAHFKLITEKRVIVYISELLNSFNE